MLRFSLKQLLALVTLSAVAVVSLRYASDWWQFGIGVLALFVLFAVLILALVDRGQRQAFAIGFAVVMVCYELLLLRESKPLPTTQLLGSFHNAVSSTPWIELATGREVSQEEATALMNTWVTNPTGYATLRQEERPNGEAFMEIGHLWWALLLGYCGGHFARFVYLRRIAEQAPAEKGD